MKNLRRHSNPLCFVVGPLDGTKEFVKRNGSNSSAELENGRYKIMNKRRFAFVINVLLVGNK
jgi:hypothetical protein